MTTTYESIWFKDRETAFATSFDTCCCFTSVAVFYLVHPWIYNNTHDLGMNYWLLLMLVCVGFICGLVLCCLDTLSPGVTEGKEEEAGRGIVKEVRSLPPLLWLFVAAVTTVSPSYQLQDTLASSMFQDVFGLTNQGAGLVIAVPMLVMGVFSFVGGIVVYRFGHKPTTRILARHENCSNRLRVRDYGNGGGTEHDANVGGLVPRRGAVPGQHIWPRLLLCSLLVLCHVCFLSSIRHRYIVKEELVGFSLGVIFTMLNVSSAIFAYVCGVIRDRTTEYRKGYLFVNRCGHNWSCRRDCSSQDWWARE